MCGIAGIVRLGGASHAQTQAQHDAHAVRTAMQALAHRGPDGEGFHAAVGATLGHRLLAIRHPGEGAQPWSSPSGELVLVYNGELYNAEPLRRELEAFGWPHPWRGRCDTEVLAAALEHWGLEQTLPRLDGMFAFAAWLPRLRQMWLARDAFGIKPLLYSWSASTRCLRFASEMRAMRALGYDEAFSIDEAAVVASLVLNSIPAPLSAYAQVARLEPGCFLRLTTHGASPSPTRWFDAPAVAMAAREQGAAVGQGKRAYENNKRAYDIRQAVQSAVFSQLAAEVTTGVLLSGGIDSTVIAHAAQGRPGTALAASTLGIAPSLGFDESAQAGRTADALGMPMHRAVLSDDRVFEQARAMAAQLAEPFGDSSLFAAWQLAHHTSQHMKVALSGEGGDELFGGYETYRAHWLAERLWFPGAPLSHMLGSLWQWLPATPTRVPWRYRASHFFRAAALPHWAERHLAFKPILPQAAAHETFSNPYALAMFSEPAAQALAAPYRAMLADTAVYLPNDLLHKVDMASMAFGLEVRVPFLTRQVFTAAWEHHGACPAIGPALKPVLRRYCAELAPKANAHRRAKRGFSVPIASWFSGPLGGQLLDLAAGSSPSAGGARGTVARLLGPLPSLDTLVAQHRARRADNSRALWNLLMLLLWAETADSPNS